MQGTQIMTDVLPVTTTKAATRLACFEELVTIFCRMAEGDDLNVRPYDGHQASHFQALDPQSQLRVLSSFGNYVELCATVMQKQKSLSTDSNLFWQALKRFQLRPRSDLFSHIRNHYLIEIYNHEHVQIFRNWKFFEACSYSLDELLCRPWWELFKRDEKTFQYLAGIAEEILCGKRQETFVCNTGKQVVAEISSVRQLQAVVQERFVSPLFDKYQRPAGYVHAVEVLSCVSRKDGHVLFDYTFGMNP